MGVPVSNGADQMDRKCATCGDWFTPWSMSGDRLPGAAKGEFLEPVAVPTEYECVSCRSKASV